jgi:hypothetical protein
LGNHSPAERAEKAYGKSPELVSQLLQVQGLIVNEEDVVTNESQGCLSIEMARNNPAAKRTKPKNARYVVLQNTDRMTMEWRPI